ncbi:MAG: VWA domain-containing protein, partial [Verrucomicrobiota bacterium]
LLVLLGGQVQVSFLPALDHEEAESDSHRKIQLRSVDFRDRVFRTDSGDNESETEDKVEELAAQFKRQSEHLEDVFTNEGLMESMERVKPRDFADSLPDETDIPEREETALSSDTELDDNTKAPRPEIVKIDADDLPDSRLYESRQYIATQERHQTDEKFLDSLVGDMASESDDVPGKSGESSGADTGSDGFQSLFPSEGGEDAASRQQEVPDDETAPSPSQGDDDLLVESGLELYNSREDGGTDGEEEEEVVEERSIDDLLDASMKVFTDEERKEIFFRVDIKPNPRAGSLEAINKDVLLLFDSSTSISAQMLNVFKRTVSKSLAYLKPGDRFNIVNFRESPQSLFDGYEPVNPENIQRARGQLRRIRRYGKTDVYTGLAPFVGEEEREPDRPLTVFLLTDGQSTVPNKMDDQSLLRRIEKSNRRQVSIYSASYGGKINRYLLDLLAYTNKGYHLYRENLDEFENDLLNYVRSHSTIVAADLEYTATGEVADELYPKSLPHLYRNGTLTVFGKLPAETEEFALQIKGWSAREDKLNYVYHADIEKAEQGSKELMHDWIAQKAFYLIAKEALEPTEEIRSELREFQRRYNPEMPYF